MATLTTPVIAIILYLLIPFIQSQRTTIYYEKFKQNYGHTYGWLTANLVGEYYGYFATDPKCPSAGIEQYSICYCLRPEDRFYYYVDTTGYHSIQISYDIYTKLWPEGAGTPSVQFWWIRGTAGVGQAGWVHAASHTCASNPCHKSLNSLPLDNAASVGLQFYVTSGYTLLNYVRVTGLPGTATPTANPTLRPTAIPTPATPAPSLDPSPNPSSNPTNNPSITTESPTESSTNPTHSPSLDPSTNPSSNPTNNPSIPTGSPTESSTNPTPATPAPSLDPSSNPSSNPTNNPSIATGSPTEPSTNPTPVPTLAPAPTLGIKPSAKPSTAGGEKEVMESSQNTQDSENTESALEDDSHQSKNQIETVLIILIIVLTIVGVLVIGRVVFQRFIQKQKASDDQTMMASDPADTGAPGENTVKSWLTSTVGLPQYYSTFVENGYVSMEFVSNIATKEDLSDIDITIKAHQTHLLTHIKKFKEDDIAMDAEEIKETDVAIDTGQIDEKDVAIDTDEILYGPGLDEKTEDKSPESPTVNDEATRGDEETKEETPPAKFKRVSVLQRKELLVLSTAKLAKMCRKQKLPVNGKKADMANRLLAAAKISPGLTVRGVDGDI
eukprot:909186_1